MGTKICDCKMAGQRKEFGGSIGATLVVFGLPVFIAFLHIAAGQWNWDVLNVDIYKNMTASKLSHHLAEIAPNAYTWQLALGWIAMHIFLYLFGPGRIVEGQPDPDNGKRLKYPMNAAFAFAISLLLVFGGYLNGLYSPTRLVANYHRLASTAMIIGFALDIYLYIKSFFEGRPGLTAWSCLSFVFLLAQYEKHGSVSPFMALNAFLHFVYNWDALYYEQGMLTMLDIVFDPFGWMLAFGDLAYVPFLYPL